MTEFLAATGTTSTARTLTLVLFVIFVVITLGITVWALSLIHI